MQRRHLLFIAALIVTLLAPRNIAFSQDSASPQEKPSTPVGKSVQSDDDEAQLDQDIKLLRKALRSEQRAMHATLRSTQLSTVRKAANSFWYSSYFLIQGECQGFDSAHSAA